MKRVLFVTNYPSPYRVAFFDLLGSELDVTILYADRIEKKLHRNAQWFVEGNGNCQVVQLEKRLLSVKGRDLCVDVLQWLNQSWDHIVLCGYSSPTVLLAMGYLRCRGIPFWMEVDGGLIRKERKLVYLAKRFLVSGASGWLSTGKATSEYLVHYGAIRDRIKEYPFSSLHTSDILPAVVPPEEKQRLRRELGIDGEHMVLSIGQFIHRKGFDILLKAAAQLKPGVRIYIVGGEPTEEYLRLSSELGITNVEFVGFMKKEQLVKYYKASDMFVLPTREDIWGLVINEAMAYGLPGITTEKCVAGLELVENGVHGYIVPVADHEMLAGSMNQLLGEDYSAMGVNALEKIRPYTLENMAQAHISVFREELSRK